jgi:hypothetical protein
MEATGTVRFPLRKKCSDCSGSRRGKLQDRCTRRKSTPERCDSDSAPFERWFVEQVNKYKGYGTAAGIATVLDRIDYSARFQTAPDGPSRAARGR